MSNMTALVSSPGRPYAAADETVLNGSEALMIEACQLTKAFSDKKRGQIRAVDGVSFRCEPGQVFGLLGVNGAGKTTCLRLLGTILQPTSGVARVGGFDVVGEPERVRANIGFLSTATALYGRLTAQELVEYFGRLHGLAEPVLRQRLDGIFATLGMDEFRHRRCDQLSSGMKQKVSIARTLVHDPPVMIFDEPTHGLDVLTARTVVNFIRDCRARGKTVLFSTHVMREAEKLCDRIAVIHNGRILAEGTLAELRARTGGQDLDDVFIRLVEGP
jgi:sodium transport system ATP-binding protein